MTSLDAVQEWGMGNADIGEQQTWRFWGVLWEILYMDLLCVVCLGLARQAGRQGSKTCSFGDNLLNLFCLEGIEQKANKGLVCTEVSGKYGRIQTNILSLDCN